MSREAAVRRIARIPVNNLWFLMLYASDLVKMGRVVDRLYERDDGNVANLVGQMLARAAEERLRRGLTPRYVRRERIVNRVRGRIDMLRTEAEHLLAKGQVACRFEELSTDIPRNRLVRVALERVANITSGDVSRRCRSYARFFARSGVSDALPPRTTLAADVIGRNDRHDRQVVGLAKLALDMALPTEEFGPSASFEPSRDEHWVRKLYERAILGFCSVEFAGQGWRISGGNHLLWQTESMVELSDITLPRMETDVTIIAPDNRRLIIDTKFTTILTDGKFEKQSLRPSHIFQLYAYLRSQEGRGADWDAASGMLLYPSIGETVRKSVTIQGHDIMFATVDLGARPQQIRDELRNLIPWFLTK